MEQPKNLDSLMSWHERDRKILLRTVPPYMILLATQALAKKGTTLRADVMEALERASYAPLSGLDELSIARVAKRIDAVATALLHDISPDNELEVLTIVSSWVIRMVDEGIMEDRTNQSVLVALHLMDEAMAEPAYWGYNEVLARDKAALLMARGKLQGLY